MSSCSTWHVRNGLCPISMVYHLLAPITFANFDKCDLLQHFLESTKVFQEYTAALLVTYTSKRVSIINEKKLIPFRKYFLVDLTYECQAEIWCKCIAAHNFYREDIEAHSFDSDIDTGSWVGRGMPRTQTSSGKQKTQIYTTIQQEAIHLTRRKKTKRNLQKIDKSQNTAVSAAQCSWGLEDLHCKTR